MIKCTCTTKVQYNTCPNNCDECNFPNVVNNIDGPQHYGGKDNPYEAIKVIEAWRLGFHLGNTVKYISRCGKKDPAREIEDLQKALWYLQREIDNRKSKLLG